MAVNQNSGVFATQHVSHAGRIYRPGERIDGERGVGNDAIVKSCIERGIASDRSTAGEGAKRSELERRERVAAEQKSRSSKREHNKRDGE